MCEPIPIFDLIEMESPTRVNHTLLQKVIRITISRRTTFHLFKYDKETSLDLILI
jgi:hypothetical protein